MPSQTPQAELSPALHNPSAPPGPVCILVDSRCLASGAELVTSLRQRHGVSAHVCSLDGGYFIVSNRMAAERHSQADLAALQNRKRLMERVKSLQGLFERICLVVEKERSKQGQWVQIFEDILFVFFLSLPLLLSSSTGEAARPFQRTRCYDSTLIALVRCGVRLLWSSGAEDSARLLAELARLEQRKGQAITLPAEVKGQHREQALQLYLSLPSVNYIQALSMSHNFSSVAQLIHR